MAHDSDIDSWDLRQPDLSCQEYSSESRARRVTRPRLRRDPRDRGTRNGALLHENSRWQTRRTPYEHTDVGYEDSPTYTSAPRSSSEANRSDIEALNGRLSLLSLSQSANRQEQLDERDEGCYTYRCEKALISPTTPSTLLSKSTRSSVRVVSCTIGKSENAHGPNDAVEDVQRYAVNGTRVVECSASSANISEREASSCPMTETKRRAYEEWLERKRAEDNRRKEEMRRAELEKQAEEERLTREREERERRERENFLQWTERKRREEASKREEIEREMEFERRLKEVEDKAVVAKTIYLRQWVRRKEQQQKAIQRREEMRKKRDAEERKRRLEASEKAYVQWRETSKNRPRPATQGLLPHQTAKPSYVNPNPWIGDDDVKSQEATMKKSSPGNTRELGTSETGSKKSLVSK